MKTLWALWFCTLLVGLTVAAHALEYDSGQPILLQVQVSSYKVTPGQTVQISLSASDIDYIKGPNGTFNGQVNDPVTLTWEANAGDLKKMSVGSNPVDLLWSSPMTPGYYAIYVKAQDSGKYANDPPVSRIIEIAVQPLGGGDFTPAVRVGANPQTVRLSRGSISVLTAQLYGKSVAGKEIRFYATGGTLSGNTATTDANGVASVQLTVGKNDLGSISVAAYYGNTTATTTVEVVTHNPTPAPYPPAYVPNVPNVPLPLPVLPPNSQGVLVDVQPATLPADGQSTAIVTVRVTDARGIGYPMKPVLFRTTMGIVQPMGVTDPMGYARVPLTAATAPGVAVVAAQIDALQGYTLVSFTPLQPAPVVPAAPTGPPRIFLTVDPNSMTADGVSKARVEALVLDSDNHAAVGAPVYFTATLGTLQQGAINTGPDGRAVTTLTAADRPGLTTISAQVGQTIAASQLAFTTAAPSAAALDIRSWGGQQSGFVAEKWLLRQIQIKDGTNASLSQTLQIIDDNAKVIKEYDLGKFGILITDQNGIAQGLAIEEDDKIMLTFLKPDGTPSRLLVMNLATGSHLVSARYANPAGNVLVTVSQPDGTKPELQYFSPKNDPILVLRDGLESLPVTALGSDGYLVVALPGGTVRLYNPAGVQVSEAKRADGLPAAQAAVGPGGGWVAVASAQAGQAPNRPCLSIFSRQGTPLMTFDLEATALTPVGNGALLASTPERTVYVNLISNKMDWSVAGGYDHCLVSGAYAVLAGQRDAQTKALISRVLVMRLTDGVLVNTQDFADFHSINAVLPVNEKGMVGIATESYALRFPLPAADQPAGKK